MSWSWQAGVAGLADMHPVGGVPMSSLSVTSCLQGATLPWLGLHRGHRCGVALVRVWPRRRGGSVGSCPGRVVTPGGVSQCRQVALGEASEYRTARTWSCGPLAGWLRCTTARADASSARRMGAWADADCCRGPIPGCGCGNGSAARGTRSRLRRGRRSRRTPTRTRVLGASRLEIRLMTQVLTLEGDLR